MKWIQSNTKIGFNTQTCDANAKQISYNILWVEYVIDAINLKWTRPK